MIERIRMNERQGCLLAFFRVFGGLFQRAGATETSLPYRLRDDFLSAAELSFYRVLTAAIGGEATVLCKVRLGDLFYVPRSDESQTHRNRIDRKHVDFLLCDTATMTPRCGIELDDSSHDRRERQERDDLVDGVFEAAGLPLVRIAARRGYSPPELREELRPYLVGQTARLPVERPERGPPRCPKCGILMVERVAKRGERAGERFFGCANYPKCRETA